MSEDQEQEIPEVYLFRFVFRLTHAETHKSNLAQTFVAYLP